MELQPIAFTSRRRHVGRRPVTPIMWIRTSGSGSSLGASQNTRISSVAESAIFFSRGEPHVPGKTLVDNFGTFRPETIETALHFLNLFG